MAATSKLYIWPNRSLYLGIGYVPLREYTVTSDQLVVCLEGEISFQRAGDQAIVCRTILMRAGTRVTMSDVDSTKAVVAIAYLSPVAQDYHALLSAMAETEEGNGIHLAHEEELIAVLRGIRDQNLGSAEAYALFEKALLPPDLKQKTFIDFDQRILTVMKRIKESLRDNTSIADLASEVFLSESRLVKLFRAQIGIPITKFRIRYRVFVGVIYLSIGYSVTEAAHAAGFASTAHFSKCFSAMMGIQPSSSFLRPPFIEVILADEILAAIAQREAKLADTGRDGGMQQQSV